jgi:hypothetical protein
MDGYGVYQGLRIRFPYGRIRMPLRWKADSLMGSSEQEKSDAISVPRPLLQSGENGASAVRQEE